MAVRNRIFYKALGIVGAVVLVAVAAMLLSRPPKPPIIVISVDTLRADHLGFHGYARPTSPHLDAFAAHGVVFEDASSTTSWTLPSHASMLTGLYPLRHRVR